ncbi:Pentatricopeptide repeat-containing protein At1g31430 [Ancistrocladus abbreviatus]
MELGKEIHDYIEEKLHFSPIIGNSLLNMYVKRGYLNIAQKIFDKMPTKNVMCWTSLISGYINCGRVDEARSLFERSPGMDFVLWTAMINGYMQFNRFDEAMELFHETQIRRLKLDKFTMVTLLIGCAQTGALEQGKWIHEYMDENRFPVDAVVGTTLIEMYAKWVFQVLAVMRGWWKKGRGILIPLERFIRCNPSWNIMGVRLIYSDVLDG